MSAADSDAASFFSFALRHFAAAPLLCLPLCFRRFYAPLLFAAARAQKMFAAILAVCHYAIAAFSLDDDIRFLPLRHDRADIIDAAACFCRHAARRHATRHASDAAELILPLYAATLMLRLLSCFRYAMIFAADADCLFTLRHAAFAPFRHTRGADFSPCCYAIFFLFRYDADTPCHFDAADMRFRRHA